MTISGGIFVLQQVYNKQVSETWPTKAPAISPPITNISSVNEGGSVIINVNTFDYEGQTLYWTIQGVTGTINSSDFTNFSGSFTVQANNFGTFTITTIEDLTTEGTESFVVQIRTDSTSGSIKATSETITINDTSVELTPSYGWFAAGGPGAGPLLSIVDRVNFSNDTSTASVRGPLNNSISRKSATGNINFGWFAGGLPDFSGVDRITFTSDTGTASVRGPLGLGRDGLAATGNSNFGWFGGGQRAFFSPTGPMSTVERINFSGDTGTASTRGPLSLARWTLGATGNNDFGWFGGGYVDAVPAPTIGSRSTVDRINYADDTTTALTRGPLTISLRGICATGDLNFGWFGGGRLIPSSPSYVTYSNLHRVVFSNDASSLTVRGSLSANKYTLAATSDKLDFGWFGGGLSGGTPATVLSIVDRITFASDTGTAPARGPLSLARMNLSATSGAF
jgi:hypothetical protein